MSATYLKTAPYRVVDLWAEDTTYLGVMVYTNHYTTRKEYQGENTWDMFTFYPSKRGYKMVEDMTDFELGLYEGKGYSAKFAEEIRLPNGILYEKAFNNLTAKVCTHVSDAELLQCLLQIMWSGQKAFTDNKAVEILQNDLDTWNTLDPDPERGSKVHPELWGDEARPELYWPFGFHYPEEAVEPRPVCPGPRGQRRALKARPKMGE